jgi:hypothetical protein
MPVELYFRDGRVFTKQLTDNMSLEGIRLR